MLLNTTDAQFFKLRLLTLFLSTKQSCSSQKVHNLAGSCLPPMRYILVNLFDYMFKVSHYLRYGSSNQYI